MKFESKNHQKKYPKLIHDIKNFYLKFDSKKHHKKYPKLIGDGSRISFGYFYVSKFALKRQ